MRMDPVDAARFYLQGLATLHLKRQVPDDQVEWLLERSPPVEYPRGAVVFSQGDIADTALLVVRGKLTATVSTGSAPGGSGDREVGEIGPWDVVGETALYAPDRPRNATVTAARESACLVIAHRLLVEGRSNPVVAAIEYHLLHTISQRIRGTNRVIQETRAQIDEPWRTP